MNLQAIIPGESLISFNSINLELLGESHVARCVMTRSQWGQGSMRITTFSIFYFPLSTFPVSFSLSNCSSRVVGLWNDLRDRDVFLPYAVHAVIHDDTESRRTGKLESKQTESGGMRWYHGTGERRMYYMYYYYMYYVLGNMYYGGGFKLHKHQCNQCKRRIERKLWPCDGRKDVWKGRQCTTDWSDGNPEQRTRLYLALSISADVVEAVDTTSSSSGSSTYSIYSR